MSKELDLANLRKEYSSKELSESMVSPDPYRQFEEWFKQAQSSEVMEPNAMCLSTATDKGFPSARIVLLKGVDERGFSFYTNYHSKKGQMLMVNNQAALTFFWPELERQVRIEGLVEKLPAEESDAYFASRPRGSQIGAWVSDQSEPIANRKVLEEKLQQTESNFEGKEVMRPPHWGGYVLEPRMIEFWQGRESRLHDRIEYQRKGGEWVFNRLSP